jgi:outer membrane protein TolC
LEEIAQLNYEQINRNLSADLSRAFEQFQDQLNIYKLTSNNVDIAKTRLELSEDRFERGLISSLEYRDAQLAYLNASLQATQSLYALNVANLDIKRLCGNITEGLN